MKQRTMNPRNPSYPNYGGRGIRMLPEWESSYPAFRDWVQANLGPRPRGKTLDRIDNGQGYEPGNMRWATKRQQQNNRRNTARVCEFPDCGRRHSAQGLCQSHHRQHQRGEELRPIRTYTRN